MKESDDITTCSIHVLKIIITIKVSNLYNLSRGISVSYHYTSPRPLLKMPRTASSLDLLLCSAQCLLVSCCQLATSLSSLPCAVYLMKSKNGNYCIEFRSALIQVIQKVMK